MREWMEQFLSEVNSFLCRHGAETLNGLFIFQNAGGFLAGSSMAGLAVGILGGCVHWSMGMAGICLGFSTPAFILCLSDKQDNTVIMEDLKWLYETISVQLEAGLPIQQALLESEEMLKNNRLKKAMKRLSQSLVAGDDLEHTLQVFESSFSNHYIDSFCLILRQMQDSGYAVKLLSDVRIQIEEMERMQLIKKKASLEMELQIFQILLFLGIMVMVMYGCIISAVENFKF